MFEVLYGYMMIIVQLLDGDGCGIDGWQLFIADVDLWSSYISVYLYEYFMVFMF